MSKIQFSAADIRVFLAEHLPYYEAEDKDDFLYIAKASDIERTALELYRHLTRRSSRALGACAGCHCLPKNKSDKCTMKGCKYYPPPA